MDPAITLPLVVTGLIYGAGVRRCRQIRGLGGFPRSRVLFFGAGLAVTYVALQGPIDAQADLLFSVHMVQHLLLTMVAAPLLVLGTPVTLALRASSPRARRRVLLPILKSRAVRVVANPLVGWSVFILVMWGSHFTSFYEAAIRNDGVHALEHVAYLVSAMLFWLPVVGLDPIPSRLSHAARLLYLFLAMPQMAFLGLAIYSSDHLLYQHYATVAGATSASALADQHLAGVVMWEGSMLLMVLALAAVLLDWMRRDEQAAARADERAV
jgi:putative copper resistance protein D